MVYVLYNLSYAILSYPAGVLSDRVGRKKVMVSGYLLFAAIYAVISLTTNPDHFWPLFAVYGFYIAFTEGVSKAMIVDLVDTERRGTAMGAWQTVTGLATFFASFVAGLLWQYVGSHAPFMYGSGMALLASVLFILFVKEPDRSVPGVE
jgi:MFS family permease